VGVLIHSSVVDTPHTYIPTIITGGIARTSLQNARPYCVLPPSCCPPGIAARPSLIARQGEIFWGNPSIRGLSKRGLPGQHVSPERPSQRHGYIPTSSPGVLASTAVQASTYESTPSR
jgi:hypothetical protein